ncbi:carboxypeptidase-like regulatory domain-containing protein [Hymenobacter daeguensis]
MLHSPLLHIPQPCAESWDAMTPTSAGRHCAACQKTVVDFTLKTDAEILAYLATAAGGRTCGRFAAGQLERPLQRAAPAAPTARWRAWLAAVVAVWGVRETLSVAAKAQAPMEMQRKIGKPVMTSNLRATRKPDYEGAGSVGVVRGRVVDAATGAGLPGVTILANGTTIGCSSQPDGTFELDLAALTPGPAGVEIVASSIGFVPQRRLLNAEAAAVSQVFNLEVDRRQLTGEVIITAMYRKMPPAPWHPRRFYGWGKYWITRPFRRN